MGFGHTLGRIINNEKNIGKSKKGISKESN